MPSDRIQLSEIQSAINDAGVAWEARATRLSSLSLEEQKKRLGVVPPPGEPSIEEIAQRALASQAEVQKRVRGAAGLPSSKDWRSEGYVTAVKDQLSCGSCVSFGTVSTVESKLRIQRADPNLAIDLSEAHLFFCHARDRGRDCSNGWWPNEAMDDFRDKGVVDEACYPYDLSNTDCSGLCSDWANRVVKITGYQDLTNRPEDIKSWIATQGPVSACFVVYQDFFSYSSGVYRHVTGARAGGHCVCIVGYDDNLQCWICKNSWGTNWGDQGYVMIGYGECAIDSWQNHGVDGVVNTGWQTDRRVTGLWTTNEERNAWAYFDGLGWRKVAYESDNAFINMLTQLAAAKAAGRPVNFVEDNSLIKQLYVF